MKVDLCVSIYTRSLKESTNNWAYFLGFYKCSVATPNYSTLVAYINEDQPKQTHLWKGSNEHRENKNGIVNEISIQEKMIMACIISAKKHENYMDQPCPPSFCYFEAKSIL